MGNVSAKSSFQTKSSQSVQATRKANVQSQVPKATQHVRSADLLFPVGISEDIESEEKLLKEPKVSRDVNSVVRGTLVELEVKLSGSPLFNMGSIITEVATISEDHRRYSVTVWLPCAGADQILMPNCWIDLWLVLCRFGRRY